MAAQIAAAAQAGETIEVAGVSLAADDLLIETTEGAGAATAQEAGYAVAVNTETTPELEREGWAREIVHLVQGMRRSAGFEVADRIELWLTTEDEALRSAVEEWGSHIQDETLALSLYGTKPEPDAHQVDEEIEGMTIALGVRKIAT
jgi:isoleucyl-tRNA synthetase